MFESPFWCNIVKFAEENVLIKEEAETIWLKQKAVFGPCSFWWCTQLPDKIPRI